MKLLLFFVTICFFAAPCCHADKLIYPSHTPVSFRIVQKWQAEGTREAKPVSDKGTIQFEFGLMVSPQKDASITLTRVIFDIRSKGVSVTYDSSHPENTTPTDLNSIFDSASQILHTPLHFWIDDDGTCLAERVEFLKKFNKYLHKQFRQTKDANLKKLFKPRNLWFLDPDNFEDILTQIFFHSGKEIKNGAVYSLEIEPVFSNFYFQDYSLDEEQVLDSSLHNSQKFAIKEVSAELIKGIFSGNVSVKIKERSGYHLNFDAKLKGHISWKRDDALKQQQLWTWEGNFQSDKPQAAAKIHFFYEQTIEVK